MNIYTQILSITLGGLLSISEILPFIRTVKTNGIMHFLVDSIVDCNPEDLENLIEREPLVNSSGSDTSSSSNDTNDTSNDSNNDLNTKVTETLQDNDKKLDIISSELRKLDIIDHNLQEYISHQYNDDRKFKVVIKDDINDILHQLKDIKVETSEILSDKHDCIVDKRDYIVTKICDHVNKTCEHLNNANIENTKLTIDNIKNDFNTIDIETLFNNISNQLREIKEDKTESFSRKNVEDILEMILQHLRDLQRSQLQWTHNYGENNIKNDLKFEQIMERMNEIHELLQSNKLSHKISDQINSQKKHTDELKYQFQNEVNEHIDKMNEQFVKQLNMFKEMNNNFETNFIELKRKLADVTNKVDDVVIRSNEYSEKKKKRSFLNGSG